MMFNPRKVSIRAIVDSVLSSGPRFKPFSRNLCINSLFETICLTSSLDHHLRELLLEHMTCFCQGLDRVGYLGLFENISHCRTGIIIHSGSEFAFAFGLPFCCLLIVGGGGGLCVGLGGGGGSGGARFVCFYELVNLSLG